MPVTGFPLGCCCDHSYSAWTTISDRGGDDPLHIIIIGIYSCALVLMNLSQAFPLLNFQEAISPLVDKGYSLLQKSLNLGTGSMSICYVKFSRCVCFGSFLALFGSAFASVPYFSPRKVTYGNCSPLLHLIRQCGPHMDHTWFGRSQRDKQNRLLSSIDRLVWLVPLTM